jgi:3-phosphoshikimate 1-carboxyvinyltransferase
MLLISELESRFGKTIPLSEISNCEDTMLISQHIETIRKSQSATLDCKNSGTAFRFLLALCAVTQGEWMLTASPRMEMRQVKPLVNLLRNLGSEVSSVSKKTLLPLKVRGKMLLQCHKKTLHLPVLPSSQIISAIYLIRNLIQDFDLTYSLKQSSIPYIKMTKSLMKNPPQEIERDWSSAAFAYCLMAIRKRGSVIIPDLKISQLQGDSAVRNYFKNFGVLTEFTDEGTVLTFDRSLVSSHDIELDVSQCPDLYLPLLVASEHLTFSTLFLGTETLRYKETDRLAMTSKVLNKSINPLHIKTFGDHRIAMSYAMLAFRYGKVTLDDPDCVNKSFPDFWRNFE